MKRVPAVLLSYPPDEPCGSVTGSGRNGHGACAPIRPELRQAFAFTLKSGTHPGISLGFVSVLPAMRLAAVRRVCMGVAV